MNRKSILAVIIAVAALLRLINLAAGDIIGSDEVFYAFRSIGMLDFDNAPRQTTPLQWQDPDIQWWAKLSFHDHPPLVFLIQNFSMKIFGENNFGFRLPSVLLGIASVYLIFLIAKKLFSEQVGLISAAIAAVAANHVYISRSGLQESTLIFFILLASYLFLRALERDKYFVWTGIALGLGALSKYNALILVPIFLTHLILYRRDVFKNRRFWMGILAAAIVFSPVIVYNLMLYKTVGHFDFQFSYIFGQNPATWQEAPGKEAVGNLSQRVGSFLPNLFAVNSWLFLALFAASLTVIFKKQNRFVLISLIWLTILIFKIGPTYRFLAMLTPFMIMNAGNFSNNLWERWLKDRRKITAALAAVFMLWEIFYSANSQIFSYPAGPKPWTFSALRYENYNWGYNELADYFQKEFKGKFPALAFDAKYQFLEKIKGNAIARAKARGDRPFPAMLIYDGNLAGPAQLWIFDRLQIYHGWPVADLAGYLAILRINGADYFRRAGLTNLYFVAPTGNIPLKFAELDGPITGTGEIFEKTLIAGGLLPTILKNKRGEEIFRIFRF